MDKHSVARWVWRAQRARSRLLLRVLPERRIAPLQCRFEMLLGETSTAARALVYDWFSYKQLEIRSWTGTGARRDDGRLLDAQRVGEYVGRCPRGIVVATIHMGDYLEGLRQLRLAAPVQRRVFVIRRNDWSAAEQRVLERAAPDLALTVLRRGAKSIATAIRELRCGAILVVLYDLPARYGKTVAVNFFGRNAHVVRGPAELALAGGADVLPLFSHYDAHGATLVEAMPVVAAAAAPHNRRDRAAALTQRLCTLAEAQIRRHPGQWAHWSLVHELIDSAGDSSAMPRRYHGSERADGTVSLCRSRLFAADRVR